MKTRHTAEAVTRRKLARFACLRRPKSLNQGKRSATTAFDATNKYMKKCKNKFVEALVLFPGGRNT